MRTPVIPGCASAGRVGGTCRSGRSAAAPFIDRRGDVRSRTSLRLHAYRSLRKWAKIRCLRVARMAAQRVVDQRIGFPSESFFPHLAGRHFASTGDALFQVSAVAFGQPRRTTPVIVSSRRAEARKGRCEYVDMRYPQFCLTDSMFYERPPAGEREEFGFSAPDGWTADRGEVWTMVARRGARLPAQGWKVHVSTVADSAREVLAAVREHALAHGVAFKFLNDLTTLVVRNGKYADRSGSGKFVTLYPVDVDQLRRTLEDLGDALAGFPGPYILNDARWRDGPLYVRYGGFARRYLSSPDGGRILAISDDTGALVPDIRAPEFVLPDWVPVPDFLTECVKARNDPGPGHEFPFRDVQALHFSNGGGVYRAIDERTGRRVILKEARPHAGVDRAGRDAVRRLQHEWEVLRALAHTGVVPEPIDQLVIWEHHFIVEEHIEGAPLGRVLVARNPLVDVDPDESAVAEFATWALDVLDRVEEALRTVHEAGIVFGDVHPHNIFLRPDGRIAFIDLEGASRVADDAPNRMAAPGYLAPDGRRGVDTDLYAMACLRLNAFTPLSYVLPLHPAKAGALADNAARRFALPEQHTARIVQVLRDRRPPDDSDRLAPAPRVTELARRVQAGDIDWPALRDSITAGILAAADPGSPDRLFPGDIEQFTSNGIGLAHGAAGVLHALALAGAGRFPEHERWLLDAVRRGRHNGHVGFYDGLHGVAHALAGLGLRDEALDVLDRAMPLRPDELGHNLFDGLAGIGLNLLHFAGLTGDAGLTATAVELGGRIAEGVLEPGERDPRAARPRAGLMHGASGRALLLTALHRATGDGGFLDAAETALSRDLDRCAVRPDGSTHVDEGWRLMPYVATGSLGIGLVLREFLRHRDQPAFAEALTRMGRTARSEFIIGAGVFNGRAGFLAFLTGDDDPTGAASATAAGHVRRLAWHMTPYRGQVAFPGDQLLRLSTDLATGSAGVLAAMATALDGRGDVLPFLGRTPHQTPPATIPAEPRTTQEALR
ncbi:class III lanthionine synthetase LanKC [Actinosynnema sp. NPDC050436]|uniref:class III lanthionine synthetase LanKC n=1 Tax=Actinosynnema sp. NPDC050436 TaxID=3155659 RepID=UPI0033C71AAE